MNEKIIKSRLDNIKGLKLFYGNTPFTLDTYRIDTQYERVYMRNLDTGKEIDRPFNALENFIIELKPAPEQNLRPAAPVIPAKIIETKKESMDTFTPTVKTEDAPKTFTDLRNILLNNIILLQTGKINVTQAKEIANQAQTIINITKVELEYHRAQKSK